MDDWQGMEFELGDELVIYRPENDKLFVLNHSAATIWQAWRRDEDIGRISRLLAEKYEAPIARLRNDTELMIGQWRNQGLIGNISNPETHIAELNGVQLPGQETPAALPGHWYSKRYYRLYDFVILMRFADAGLEKAIHPLFAHLETGTCTKPETCFDLVSLDDHYQLQEKNRAVISYETLDMLAMGVFREAALRAYRERDTLLVIHGAAIADDEQCIVMPGAGGSGKSTLTAALLQQGFTYLSDDVVPIDRNTGHAIPLPICLNLKQGSLEVLKLTSGSKSLHERKQENHQVWYFEPTGYRNNPPQGNYPVKYLVFPSYAAGGQTRLRALTAGQALQKLIESQSLIESQKDKKRVTELLNWLVKIPAYTLEYGSLNEATEDIASLLSKVSPAGMRSIG
jgi:hypothetical protein